jgi:enterochelin esterase family protein
VQNVPHGEVTKMPAWESKIFEGTTREWWVYVPAQFKPDGSAAVMVFQDGHDLREREGQLARPGRVRQPDCEGRNASTVAIFVNPGHKLKPDEDLATVKWKANNARSNTTASATATPLPRSRRNPSRGGEEMAR